MNNFDYFLNFEEIIFCFDMDEVGCEGVVEVVEFFIDYNVKIMFFLLKDFNEMLLVGCIEEFINVIWNV